MSWPDRPEERDILYFLVQSFRSQLIKELPEKRNGLGGNSRHLAQRAKELLVELANISLEAAQMAVTPEDGKSLPDWFVVEVVRDLPALAARRRG